MTWIELLRKKLPDSVYVVRLGAIPPQCPNTLLGEKAPGIDNRCGMCSMIERSCWECWYSEVDE